MKLRVLVSSAFKLARSRSNLRVLALRIESHFRFCVYRMWSADVQAWTTLDSGLKTNSDAMQIQSNWTIATRGKGFQDQKPGFAMRASDVTVWSASHGSDPATGA